MSATSSVDAGQTAGAAPSGGTAALQQTGTPPAPAGVLEEVTRIAASAREAFASFLDLVTLEAHHAGVTLVWMVAGGIAAALLGVTGWLALVAGLAMWIVSLGFPPAGAVVAIALVSLCTAGALIYLCIGMSRALLFPATRRQLTGKPPEPTPAP